MKKNAYGLAAFYDNTKDEIIRQNKKVPKRPQKSQWGELNAFFSKMQWRRSEKKKAG